MCMVSEFNDVVVSGIEIFKAPKKAIVALEGGTALDVGWYKLTNNNESSFLAMVTVFNAGTIIGTKKVTVGFPGSFSGSPPTDKPIEQVIMPG